MYHAAGNAGRGSSSYIDSVILRDRDANGGGGWTGASDGTLEERRFYVQNWRADVVAMAKSDGTPLEYVFYSAYGEATVHPIADVDMDGDVDSYDAAAWDNGENLGLAYNYVPANVDLNWDGTEDAADDALFDESYAANVGLSGKGRMSSVGVSNRKGYAGYEHDESIAMYHVRHRVYRPDLGRWMTRDPLGYVDGMGLYEYVAGMAVKGKDPSGLARAVPCGSRGCGAAQPVIPPAPVAPGGPPAWLTINANCVGVLPAGIWADPKITKALNELRRNCDASVDKACATVTVTCDLSECDAAEAEGCTVHLGPPCPSSTITPRTRLIHELRHVQQFCSFGDMYAQPAYCDARLAREFDAYAAAEQCVRRGPGALLGSCCTMACNSVMHDDPSCFTTQAACMARCGVICPPGNAACLYGLPSPVIPPPPPPPPPPPQGPVGRPGEGLANSTSF